MTTEEIMALALEMAGLSEIPTDSGLWVPGRNVERVLFGMDLGPAELLMAKLAGFDLALAHHPPEATLEAWRVYGRHVEFMVAAGVPRVEAEAAVAEEQEAMQLRAQARNLDHTVSVARFLGMPFANIHLPLDEIGRRRMQEAVDGLPLEGARPSVGEVAAALGRMLEAAAAPTRVLVVAGDPSAPAGRVVVSHAALDIPTYPILEAYFRHGVDTVVTLRANAADAARLRRERLGNQISVGHLVGDNLGFTPFLEALEARGLEITCISGGTIANGHGSQGRYPDRWHRAGPGAGRRRRRRG